MSTIGEDNGISIAVTPRLVTLWISGEIDLSTLEWFSRWLDPLRAIDADVHLQLQGLRFISARGTSLIVDLAGTLATGRTLVAHQPPNGMRLMLTKLWPTSRVVIADQETRDDDPPGTWEVVRQWDPI